MNTTIKQKKLFLILLTVSIIAVIFYLFVRIYLVLISNFTWIEAFFAFSLLLAECFILIHTIGYFLNIYRVVRRGLGFSPIIPEPKLTTYPPVAIVVASYKEPLDILKDTLLCFYNLSYPNKHLYFLDDTRYELPWDTEENKQKYRRDIEELCQFLEINLFRANWHGAKAGIINDFLLFLNGEIREDFDYHHYAKVKSSEPEKYLIIFDADMNPFPDFVEYMVDKMEKNPNAAFTQSPQYYSNFEFNRVARAAGLQQAIFYEYICEGKDLQGAMFCCGTNVIFRREALNDVKGFDETSVTEDFATSIKLHKKGWESIYLNRVSAFGMGPEDLGAFFKQQFRWARGTIGILRVLPVEMLKNFRNFTINQWWEYLLSSTHYLIGLVFFIMISFPILYLFFDVPSYLADPIIYALAFFPYILLTMLIFVWTLKKRRYLGKDIVQIFFINAVTFPVFIKASISALLGMKESFDITPKGGSTILSLKSLAVQMSMIFISMVAIIWGIQRLYYEQFPFYGLLVNILWTLYNFIMLSSVLYFNHAEEHSLDQKEA